MFGRPIRSSCPLAVHPHTVCAVVPAQRPIQVPASASASEVRRADGSRCYTLPADAEFDLALPAQSPPLSHTVGLPPPPLYASRSFTGHGQERGGVQAVLRNPSATDAVDFVYLESLPWFMKPYLHTLKTTLSPPPPPPPNNNNNNNKPPAPADPRTALYYRPVLDRHRGTHLEVALRLPPNSTLTLSYDFDKSILRYTEYPPDANRGFDIAPAVITVTSPGPQRGFSIRTTSLLLNLPTPDFSMPYNTIILSSTVIALAFGSVFNLLVRRFVARDEMPRRRVHVLVGLLGRAVGRLIARAGRRRGAVKVKGE